MNLQISISDDLARMRWAGALNLYTVEAAREALMTHLENMPGLELDLGHVESCDAAGIQILIAARRSALDLGKTFVISQLAASIQQAAELLGIDTTEFQFKQPNET